MKSDINLVRAVGTEFLGRKYRFILVLFVNAAVIILALLIWLASMSAWWWLLLAPAIILTLVGVVAMVAVWVIVRVLRPQLTKGQASGTREFVDKLERVADSIGTPVWLLAFRVLRDVIRPRGKTFLEELADDSQSLHPDFVQLRRQFKR